MSSSQLSWAQAKALVGCVLAAVVLVAVIDLGSTGNFQYFNLSAVFALADAMTSRFEGLARSGSWRPWFYLLGVTGLVLCCRSMVVGEYQKGLRRLASVAVLALVSFAILDNADPGRVHRTEMCLTVTFAIAFAALFTAAWCRMQVWNDLSGDGKAAVIAAGLLGLLCLIFAVTWSYSFKTNVAQLADVSAEVEERYGAELRSMQFEHFYNESTPLFSEYWIQVAVAGKAHKLDGLFSLVNPDDEDRLLVDRKFSFELGMIDNKPVVLIGDFEEGNLPRERVVRSVSAGVESAITIIRRVHREAQLEQANRRSW